jgi:hypothetical protein
MFKAGAKYGYLTPAEHALVYRAVNAPAVRNTLKAINERIDRDVRNYVLLEEVLPLKSSNDTAPKNTI